MLNAFVATFKCHDLCDNAIIFSCLYKRLTIDIIEPFILVKQRSPPNDGMQTGFYLHSYCRCSCTNG